MHAEKDVYKGDNPYGCGFAGDGAHRLPWLADCPCIRACLICDWSREGSAALIAPSALLRAMLLRFVLASDSPCASPAHKLHVLRRTVAPLLPCQQGQCSAICSKALRPVTLHADSNNAAAE